MENHKSVMHGAAFFYFRAERVGPKENFFEWGGAGQGVKSSGLCGVTVKFGVFSGRGRVALKIFRGSEVGDTDNANLLGDWSLSLIRVCISSSISPTDKF